MKNFKLLLLSLSVFMLTLSACRKNDSPAPIEAKVVNAGAVAADGCGWVIRIGDTNYSPTNLDDKFKETDLNVIVSFEVLSSKFQCGWGQKIDEIKLLSIKKK